jgi:serine/threonine protein kinase
MEEYEKIETALLEGVEKYEIYINKILSKGTNTTIYIGRKIKNNENIVIKKLEITNKTTTLQMQEIVTETSISNFLKNKKSDNIVKIIDIIENFDNTYIIMEYYEGGNLLDLMINKKIDNNNIKIYFNQILNAISFLNDNNIVHGDIKPENILLTIDKKNIKICDFCFAKKINNIDKNLLVRGSPLYMPPELLNNNYNMFQSDIWALGMILYEMIFGYHPLKKCKDINDLKIEILELNKKIDNHDINNIDKSCIELLKRMLDINVDNRITLNDIKNHDWIKLF